MDAVLFDMLQAHHLKESRLGQLLPREGDGFARGAALDESFAMIEAESAFQFLGLLGVALEAMPSQEGAYFLFEESDVLGLEGLPVGSQCASQAQKDEESSKFILFAPHL